jgi:hypothetical protein
MLRGSLGGLPSWVMPPNLTVDSAVPYLLERHLVNVAAIVDGDLEVTDLGRRNQNLKIVRRHGPSYFIKQPGEGERATQLTIRCEASLYRHCHSDRQAAALRGLLPTLYDWDEERGLLVLELVDGQPLWAHYAATPAPEFPLDTAEPVGTALGSFHRVFREQSTWLRSWTTGLNCVPPWILFAHRPTPDMFAHLSPANIEVLKLLQQNEPIAAGLDSLRADWTAETLIHNDLKGDNILVTRNAEDVLEVRILDWELIQIGDPAWDVGCVLRDFLHYWLLHVPLSLDLTPEQMLEASALPLAKLRPAVRAFWHAYCTSARIASSDVGSFLLRSLRFAAARLAQGAYELSSSGAEPSNFAVESLQLAANILLDPRDASLHLFGIPVPWRRA